MTLSHAVTHARFHSDVGQCVWDLVPVVGIILHCLLLTCFKQVKKKSLINYNGSHSLFTANLGICYPAIQLNLLVRLRSQTYPSSYK